MSWGNKLLVTFIVFAGGMIFLVCKSIMSDFQMVEKDYYKKELSYQQVIDGTKEAGQLSSLAAVQDDEKGITIQLPAEMKNKNPSGEVWFYCAYDEKRDRHFKLETDGNAVQSIAPGKVLAGNYTVKISWKDDQKSYYAEKSVTIR